MSEVIVGDCVEVMARMPAGSVDAVVCDPPYGLEFMGKAWDKLGGGPSYGVAGIAAPGLGGRPTDWVRPSATRRHRKPNRTCETCGGRETGAARCECDEPEWKPIGARRGSDAPEGMTGGGMIRQMQAMQEWHERWAREALRVLKPGGYLLAFGGSRTYHRLACAVEDAGFEIRDRILVEGVEVPHPVELDWLYGSGFPKSLDVSKAIDKAAGAEREVVGRRTDGRYAYEFNGTANRPTGAAAGSEDAERIGGFVSDKAEVTAPATPDAERWQGWGTALKPAHEPICVARKPLSGTVVETVLAHGTGVLNIDGCRIEGTVPSTVQGQSDRAGEVYGADQRDQREFVPNGGGRWPANVVLLHREDCERVGEKVVKGSNWREGAGVATGEPSVALSGGADGSLNTKAGKGYADEDGMETVEAWECAPGCPVAALDAQTGDLQAPGNITSSSRGESGYNGGWTGETNLRQVCHRDSGGASRFFYCAKASRAERNAGLEGFEDASRAAAIEPRSRRCRVCGSRSKRPGEPWPSCGHDDWEWVEVADEPHRGASRNLHPTVKPVELMRWLVRLVTPPGGAVLDPFAGSGTTGIACALEGFGFVGVEQDEEYARIAEARIAWWAEHGEAAIEAERRAGRREKERVLVDGSEQLGLL